MSTGNPPAARARAPAFGLGRGPLRAVLGAVPALAFLAALVLLWEAWVRVFGVESYLVPAPTEVWSALLGMRETLPAHTRTTAIESLYGLLWAAVVGVALAAAIASIPLVRRVLYPVLVVSQTIPMVALAPLLIIWFGFGMAPKVIVVALVGFFPIVVSTADGLLGADPDMVGLVRSMGASRWQVLRHVRIPAALPAFFAGLKIAAAYAVTGAVIGEWVGASEGLGVVITRAQASYRVDRLFAAIAVISALSIVLFAAVSLLARAATPWMYLDKEKGRSQ